MRDVRRIKGLAAALLALALVSAACGNDNKKNESSTNTTAAGEKPTEGGDLVLGAEQEPDCADWIATCAQSSWGSYTMQIATMPQAFISDGSTFKATPLLDGDPKVDTNPQTVTYKISSKAVWDDGQPITSHDFKYTFDQIMSGKDILSTVGYEKIDKVEEVDQKTVKVTFKEPYADYQDLFGGGQGIYPSHLLEGKDRDALTKDGYTFSAGPWKIDHWTKGQEIKLVPNPMYWGQKPHMASVTFKFLADSAAEQQAYKTGQVSMIYPQAQLELAQLKGQPDTKFDAVTGLSFEALWMNNAAFPFDDVNVRKAFAYSVDRPAIVQQLFGPVQPDIKPIDAFITPANKTFYTDPFSVYKKDLSKVEQLMTGAGWAKGADGIWAKGGKKAEITIKSTTGNKRRELTEQILQSQLKDAGFSLLIANEKASVLFNDTLPKGNFQLSLYAQVPASADPGLCVILCSKNIPSAANGNSGQNNVRVNDPKVDKAFSDLDVTTDKDKRISLHKDGQQALADIAASLPLDPFPDIIIYNTAKIGGPVVHNPTVAGAFANMNEWFLKG